MTPFFLLPLLLMSILLFVDRRRSHRIVKDQLVILNKLKGIHTPSQSEVKCSTFTVGRKNLGFHYKKADLYLLDDAFIVVGTYTLFSKKIYRSILILSHNVSYYKKHFTNTDAIVIPKRFNKNSSNKTVYIEFGEASFSTTNVTITLYQVHDKIKKQISLGENFNDKNS